MKFENLKYKKVGIWGMGKEGTAVQKVLSHLVPEAKLFPFSDDNLDVLYTCDVVVKSPGVSLYRDEIQKAVQKGVQFTSGTSLFLENRSKTTKVIAITGTKGKSSTSSLLYHTMKNLGYSVALGGNIGYPLIQFLEDPPTDYVVAELSSYMCADATGDIDMAVLLDLYPEHTNWHQTVQRYYMDKIVLVARADKIIINGTDPGIHSNFNNALDTLTYNTPQDFHLKNGFFYDGKKKCFARKKLSLLGEHNAENACAVLTVLKQLGDLNFPKIEEAFSTFEPLPHRLQTVWKTKNLIFVDDSISTTPETALAALNAYPDTAKIVLLIGGEKRAQDFTDLAHFVAKSKGRITIIGMPDVGTECVEAVLDEKGAAFTRQDLKEALQVSIQLLENKGGIILLSPAAPSYNLYKNFEERGDEFKRLAQELAPNP